MTAQQKAVYTQYILNNYMIDPANTGIENYTDVKISKRNQWSGIDSAPVTTYQFVHGPVKKRLSNLHNFFKGAGRKSTGSLATLSRGMFGEKEVVFYWSICLTK